MNDYQSAYKAYYKQKNVIITFPMERAQHDEFKHLAGTYGITPNALAKQLSLHYLTGTKPNYLTTKQHDIIKEYIRISRGIATNINQMAYNSNIGEQIDVGILIQSLKSYDESFKDFISKLKEHDH